MTKISGCLVRRVALVAALLNTSPSLAAEVEPKSGDVSVYGEATNKSEAIGSLKVGQKLEAVERKGMFWQVKTADGKIGYVSVLQVKHKADSSSGLASAIKSAVKEGRSGDEVTESRSRTVVMGVRGLREDDSAGKAGDVRPNLRAVYDMEDKTVSPAKIEELGDKVFQEIARKSAKN